MHEVDAAARRLVEARTERFESLHALDESKRRRYSRHLIIPDVGMDGQKRLKNAKVLAVGAGGLGSPALLYLAFNPSGDAATGPLVFLLTDPATKTVVQQVWPGSSAPGVTTSYSPGKKRATARGARLFAVIMVSDRGKTASPAPSPMSVRLRLAST